MFEPENDLEKSLTKAYKEPAHRSQFYQDLLVADIYALTSSPPDLDENGILKSGTKINFKHFEHEGTPFLPIFSSLKRLQESIAVEASYSKLNARRFFILTRGETVILNPELELGKLFTPTEIGDLLNGTIFKPRQRNQVDENTLATVGKPSEYPTLLVDALSKLFESHQEVKTAYVTMVLTGTETEKPELMIGIDTSGEWENLASLAHATADGLVEPGEPVHFIRIDDSPICRHMVEHVEPFYQRG